MIVLPRCRILRITIFIIATIVVCNVFGCRFQAFFGFVFVTYFEVIIFQIIVAHVLPHDLRKAD